MTTRPVLYPNQSELFEGSLVGYNLLKGPAIGVLTKKSTGAVQILIKNQKEFTVKGQAVFVRSAVYTGLGRLEWIKLLQDREALIGDLSLQLDLAFLHACVLEDSSSKTFTFDELLQLYFGADYGFEQIMCLAQGLASDKCFFKRRKDAYQANSMQQVKAYLNEVKRREEAHKKEKHLIDFLSDTGNNSEFQLPPHEQAALMDLGLYFEKSDFYKSWLRIFREAGVRSKFHLRQILMQRGFYRPDDLFELHEAFYPLGFSKNFEEYIGQWTPGSTEGPFRDLRSLKTFTVDNESTLDRDDALSYDPETNSFYVHIINVARIVNSNQRLEKEIKKRLTSLYLPDGHFSMFPEKIVRELLSLDEGTERYVLTVQFRREQNDLTFEVYPALVSIHKNFSYADFIGSDKEARIFFEESQRLREDRLERGAVEYHHRDIEILLDGGEVQIFDRPYYPAQKVISEFSIIANSLFARFAYEQEIPILYRSQKGNIEDVRRHPLFCAEVPDFFTYHRLRPLWSKTRWDVTEVSHFHLGVPYYTQVSSPIRRFIDYLNQKQIWSFFLELKYLNKDELAQEYFNIQNHLFEVGGIQSKREFYYLLRFMAQEAEKQGSDFETEVTVLEVGEDWLSVHLDEYERVLRFKQDPEGFIPGMEALLRVREIDLEAREVRGMVVRRVIFGK